MGKNKVEKKNKKGKIIIISSAIIILAVGVFLFWWFNRKFEVTFKYNNKSYEDTIINVKYLNLIDEKDIKTGLKASGKTFIGYYEAYYLTDAEKDTVKNDSNAAKTICKEGFKLDSTKVKCVAEEEFDFKETKITKATIIEALWSSISFSINPTSKTIYEGATFTITAKVKNSKDTSVKWSSSDSNIATVDKNGKVTGVKEGKAKIYAESNGIKKSCAVTVTKEADKGAISLSTNSQCIIDNSAVTLTATVSDNAKDKTVNWTLPKCYTSEKLSNTSVKLTRSSACGSDEEKTFTVTAKLNNGASDSVKITYEPKLVVSLYYNEYSGRHTALYNDYVKGYEVNEIETNIKATFNVSPSSNYITSKDKYLRITNEYTGTVTVTTACGQTKTYKTLAVIN